VTPPRVLVACVGNPLRGDDGFGVAVATELEGSLPEEADLLETGIGGIGIVHALMDGYDALVIVDAVERGAEPGEVFVLVPQVPHIATPTFDEWLAQLSDMHLAEPSRILRIARAAGVLPEHVLVVGCQPQTCEDFAEALSAPVATAVPVVAERVRGLVAEVLTTCRSAGAAALRSSLPSGRDGRGGRH
jgi:hydrogenase maturation protease